MSEGWGIKNKLQRAEIAFMVTVIIGGLFVVADMFLKIGIGHWVITPQFGAITFGIAYILTPYILRIIKYE